MASHHQTSGLFTAAFIRYFPANEFCLFCPFNNPEEVLNCKMKYRKGWVNRCVRAYLCMCVCVLCVWQPRNDWQHRLSKYHTQHATHTHTHTYTRPRALPTGSLIQRVACTATGLDPERDAPRRVQV